MYFSLLDNKIVRRIRTESGDFTLLAGGVVKLPDGSGKDINDLIDEPISIDYQPGNVFQVIGDILYVAALKKDCMVVADMVDTDDGEPAYHSQAYLIAVDWRTWTRVWDRELGLGGLTTMSVTDDTIYVAGFREHTDESDTDTLIAKVDLSGQLTWIQHIHNYESTHPTEIEVGPEDVTVYVDAINPFQDKQLRIKMDLKPDGIIGKITTL